MQILSKQTTANAQAWLEEAKTTGATVLIDKAIGWTSFDVVARLRNVLHIQKIGHAGTLDPLAEGLLIICCGKATKTIDSFQDLEKEYETVVRLGATTETYDSEKPEQNVCDVQHLRVEDIQNAVHSFVGEIDQMPPMYSARKVGGKRLYDLARKGQEVERSTRRVTISEIDILKIELPLLHLRVRCSKGTYIRSLAHDIGQLLGVGAYMASLRRTKIGSYNADDALEVQTLKELFKPAQTTEAATVETVETTPGMVETATAVQSQTPEETAAAGSNG